MDNFTILEHAFSLYEEGRYCECADVLRPIADHDVQAQVCMGMLYWHNLIDSNQSDSLGLYWYRKAAENGHGLAQLWLANNYSVGLKSDADPTLAVYWYQKAAAQNITMAQYRLAICYSTGWGVDKDMEKSIVLMQKAANKNFFEADLFLLEHINETDENYKARLIALEEKYQTKLATDETTAYRYVDFLLYGDHCYINHERAFNILTQFSIFQSERGTILLADCYARGWGAEKSVHKACELYAKFSQNNKIARAKLKLLMGE